MTSRPPITGALPCGWGNATPKSPRIRQKVEQCFGRRYSAGGVLGAALRPPFAISTSRAPRLAPLGR